MLCRSACTSRPSGGMLLAQLKPKTLGGDGLIGNETSRRNTRTYKGKAPCVKS